MTRIIRAILVNYHVATHTADVRPILGPAAILAGLPVLESCRPDLLAADDNVAVLMWSDIGGLVLAPWGDVPAIPPSATDADTVDGEHAAAFENAGTVATHAADPDAHHTSTVFVPLLAPLTSTSFDGDSFSTVAKTLIDLSASFGAPAGIKAVLLKIRPRDSASFGTWCDLLLGPTDAADVGFEFSPHGLPDDFYSGHSSIIPCNANGDIYYQVYASGAGTFDIKLRIWGYWI